MSSFILFLILFLLCFAILIIAYTNKQVRQQSPAGRFAAYGLITIVAGGFAVFTGTKTYNALFEERTVSVASITKSYFDRYDRNPKDHLIYINNGSFPKPGDTLLPYEGAAKEDDADSEYYTIWTFGSMFKDADTDSNMLVTYPELLKLVQGYDTNNDGKLSGNPSVMHLFQGQNTPDELYKFHNTNQELSKRWKK